MKIFFVTTSNLIRLGMLFFAVGCSKSNSNPPTPTLSTNQQALTIGAPTGSKDTFNIVSNTSWTASSDQSWLTLSDTGGNGNESIVTTAAVNHGNGSTRTANVTIKASGLPDQTIIVTQQPGVVIVAGTGVQGSGLDQLSYPCSIYLDKAKNLYIADEGNNRVMLWAYGATQGTVVAGNGTMGNGLNQLWSPTGVF